MACIGDFKSLLDEYIGSDTSSIWLEAISQLINLDDVLKPSEALEQLQLNVTYESNDIVKNRKRKRKLAQMEGPKFNYTFAFQRFQRGHPHPLAINSHVISSQIVHSRFLNYDELNLSNRVILLHSEMVTGKTSNVIIKMLASLPNATVIALTPKRLFAGSLRGVLSGYGFDFAHYGDRPPRVIIEIESLWKLNHYNFQPFDFLLIDESETTITQMLYVSTHKHNLKNNWDVLIWLLQNSMKTLLADARMSNISMGFIQDHCKIQDIHYIKSTFKISLHVNIFFEKNLMSKEIMESVSKGESLYTFSGGRNNAYHLHQLTKIAFGEENSVVYSSMNSHTKPTKAELRNVNELWKDKKQFTQRLPLLLVRALTYPILSKMYTYFRLR